MLTAKSIENFFVPDVELLSPQFFIGLSTEEEGHVKPIVHPNGHKLCFPLNNANLILSVAMQEPIITMYAEKQDSSEWSFTAQVRIRVGGADDQPMEVVDAVSFDFKHRFNLTHIFRMCFVLAPMLHRSIFKLAIRKSPA